MAPMHDGKVVRPEVFTSFPKPCAVTSKNESRVLQAELEAILADAPKAEKRRRQQTAELNEEVSRAVVEDALEGLLTDFAEVPGVVSFLADIEKDLVRNSALFAVPDTEAKAAAAQIDPTQDPRLRRYMVNVIVSQKRRESRSTAYRELANPTLANLTGHVEPAPQGSAQLRTSSIQPGALHRANGGALMLDARRVPSSPAAWEGLELLLEAAEVRIETPETTGAGLGADADDRARSHTARLCKIVLLVSPEQLKSHRAIRSRLRAALQGAGRLRRYDSCAATTTIARSPVSSHRSSSIRTA